MNLDTLKKINALCESALAEDDNDSLNIKMDDYDKAAIVASSDPGIDVSVSSLDNFGTEIQVGDIVDSLVDDSKKHGVVSNIDRQISVQWEDGEDTMELAVNLVVLDPDEIEQDFEEKDIEDDEEQVDDNQDKYSLANADKKVYDDGEDLLEESMVYPGER